MKARILTSVLVAVFAVSTVVAGNPKTNIYSNTEHKENGCTKEYITMDSELRPEKKTIYEYVDDCMLEKSTYRWNSEKGWVSIQKYTYEYNEKGKPANLIYTEYGRNGELLSAKQVEVNKDSLLIAGN
ncbi:DUF3836 domain-containing protein [Dysgonomonas reticulitermitis]